MSTTQDQKKPTAKDWLAVIGSNIGFFMVIMDTVISNGALREVSATLATNIDESSWIATSYMVGEAISIPLTMWLCRAFSMRRILIFNATMFTLASILCGTSKTLTSLIVFRAIQGFTGAPFLTLATALSVTLIPRHLSFLVTGALSTLAPTIGYFLGGWITTNLSWEYSYFLNLIPGIAMLYCIRRGVDPAPTNLKVLKNGDWWGVVFMAIGLGTLTWILEEGSRADWLSSRLISNLTIVSLTSLGLFIWFELKAEIPFIQLRLAWKNHMRPKVLYIATISLMQIATAYINAVYLLEVKSLDAYQLAAYLTWTSWPQVVMLFLMPKLLMRFDPRALCIFGIFLYMASTAIIADMNQDHLILALGLRAFAGNLVIAPFLSLLYAQPMDPVLAGQTSTISDLLRCFGGSFGISMLSTIVSDRLKFHFKTIADSVPASSPTASNFVQNLNGYFQSRGLAGESTGHIVLGFMYGHDSLILAFHDVYILLTIFGLIPIACILCMKGLAPKK